MKFEIINPSTEEILSTYESETSHEVSLKVDLSFTAFNTWKKVEISHRKSLMLGLAKILLARKEEFAKLIAQEMGKPIKAGILEIERCALVMEYYANNAKDFLKAKEIKTKMKKSLVSYQPLGVILAIMPWNYPFWQVFRFAAPNIMAGNVALLKHAPNTFGAGVMIQEIFEEAGFPKGVFQNLIIDTSIAAEVIANPKVSGVTLTGSERAGSAVAALAAKNLKKSVLELGGSDPYIVLKDANLDLAAKNIVKSRLNNSGQVCISAKRVIADEKIHDELIVKISNLVKEYKVGDPLDINTQCGPLARKDLQIKVQEQVNESVLCGAKILLGGKMVEKKGYYFQPTILVNVKPGMPAFDDEIFGPVISIISAKDENDAIYLANNTRFGLSAAIFTSDLQRGEYLATHEVQAGSCFVNSMSSSNPLLPFGGIKCSGFGRELSIDGMLEFMNVKTIGICE
ncbi:MAG: succinate-semialdehyde dehydrogenase [Legionellales bacterium RIFCSPHIGHO2_12_FULL_35_11]|nr:MAG: succinate-semialdehyde dehydrogenase [Legionellales bacterium RIFCSPHIGHO2_12_FULL_35_11]